MRSDARASREALLAAGRRLFADRGPEVPMRTIAEEAGVGIGTLYRHFPQRDDLVTGIAEQVVEEVRAIVATAESRWDDDPAGTWHDFVHDLAGLALGALLPRLAATLNQDDFASEQIVAIRSRGLDAITRVVERAQAAGFVEPDLTAIRLQVGISALSRPLPDLVNTLVAELKDGWQTWLVDVYLRGLRPDPLP